MNGLPAFVLLLVVVYTADAASFNLLSEDVQWAAWKTYHKKNYKDEYEEGFRRAIWVYNLKKIEEHNGAKPFQLAMNHFGDYTNLEYRHLMLATKYDPSAKRSGSTFLPPSNVKLNASVDWRKEGYVTGVKNQLQCGSCWAFSATGSLEGQHFKKTGNLVSLSEQNLVDCSRDYGNNGCEGGLMDNAFRYIKANGGIDTEASYPYTARDGTCHFSASNVGATCTGYTDITQGSEDDLKTAAGTVGPISVAIDASHFSFQFYHRGVYSEPMCSSTKLDHGVLVVGYGTSGGKDYWLVKNSWGPSWGLDGYIWMTRNDNNQCGIATTASYPLV
ncbi:cathepsin L1-like [Dendronephthya gigantea]|uniref:cathepsin L1-like n=1 Tax=Dendronephthya gigantea TaxID=151771 RepID=UPI00106B686F|nr:cathepsin L1-like [Dendronephthya gigantea]